MSAPLLPLWWMTQRAWLRNQWRLLHRPRRLVAVLAMLAVLVFRAVSIHRGYAVQSGAAPTSLLLLGSMIFLLSAGSGFLQQGPRFASADVDFLFPAPISPRGLLLFRLLHLWPAALLSSALLVIMFGEAAGAPWRLLVGLFLLQVSALHLQLLISIALTRAGDAVARRLRGSARIALLLVLFSGVFVLIYAVSDRGGPASVVAEVSREPFARVLLFPAAACADFVAADSPLRTLLALLRLVLGAAGTFALLMVPEIDFREESIVTTARVARLLSQRRRGETVIDLETTRRVASRTGRASRLFSGAGAILWKNSIVLSRSLRTVVPGVLFGLLFVLPAVFATRRDALGAYPMVAITMATLFGSNAFNFDLRREIDRIDALRALPLPAATIVLAELVTPWVLCVALQELLVAAVVLATNVDRAFFGALALALPIVSTVLVVIDNLSVFLFAPKPGGADARGGVSAGSPVQMLRVFAWGVALAPAGGALAIAQFIGARRWVGLTSAALVALAVAAALFVALVRCFERREFAAGE